jgi:hypothetical protein
MKITGDRSYTHASEKDLRAKGCAVIDTLRATSVMTTA